MEKKAQEVIDGLAVQESKTERLKRLGFSKLARNIDEAKEMKKKLMIAYEHFRFIPQRAINEFNEKLRRATSSDYGTRYKTLDFAPIEEYEKIPPDTVLSSLEKAKKFRCFDRFEIAYIREVKDPILFGRINKCPDRFIIDQWDDDVKWQDIIKENEG